MEIYLSTRGELRLESKAMFGEWNLEKFRRSTWLCGLTTRDHVARAHVSLFLTTPARLPPSDVLPI